MEKCQGDPHLWSPENICRDKPELQRLPPSQQSAFLQFHLPSNSHEMMVTEFSSQQENLSQR